MITMTLAKMKREGARGLMIVPAWDNAPWMGELKKMADKVEVLRDPVRQMFAGRRKMNAKWGMMVAEVNLQGSRASRQPEGRCMT